MIDTKEKIKEIEKEETLTEIEISFKIREIYKNHDKLDEELIAEKLAFDFVELCGNEKNSYRNYFCSMVEYQTENGIVKYPSEKDIKKKYLDYWKKRINETENSVFKARYYGLILDFSYEFPGIEFVKHYVNILIKIVHDKKIKSQDLVMKINRALNILIKYKILEKSPAYTNLKYDKIIKNTILDLEKYLISKNEYFNVGFSLYIIKNQRKQKKFKFNEKEKNPIDFLEKYYYDLIKNEDLFYSSKNLALSLADYYRYNNDLNHSKKIIISLAESIDKYDFNLTDAQKINRIEETIDICSQYKIDKKIKKKLKNKLINLSKDSKEIKGFKMEIPIDEDTAQFINRDIVQFIEDLTKGNAEEILMKLATSPIIIPNFENVKKQVKKMSKTSPLLYMLPNTLINEEGLGIAHVKPLSSNSFDNHSYKNYSSYLSTIHGPLIFDPIFYKIRRENLLNSEDIISFLEKSPILEINNDIIKRGIELYFSGDIVSSTYILIPQIEKIIRNLTESNRRLFESDNCKNMNNTNFNVWKYLPLKDLLNDIFFTSVFGENSEDIQKYFNILLNHKLGWNIRNRVCHGLVDENFFNYVILDRLIHILLILGSVRLKPM